jgi:hypothetical protein
MPANSTFTGKGLRSMKYKWTKVYTGEAPSKKEFVEKLKANPTEHLKYEGVKEIPSEGVG